MSILAFEKIVAEVSDGQREKRLPQPIKTIFAKAGVAFPHTGTIPLDIVDKALAGHSIAERMRIKSQLNQLGWIK